jgi:hypothetical protein
MFYKVITVLVVVGFGFMALVHLEAPYSQGSTIFTGKSSWVEKRLTGEYRGCGFSKVPKCSEWMYPQIVNSN